MPFEDSAIAVIEQETDYVKICLLQRYHNKIVLQKPLIYSKYRLHHRREFASVLVDAIIYHLY